MVVDRNSYDPLWDWESKFLGNRDTEALGNPFGNSSGNPLGNPSGNPSGNSSGNPLSNSLDRSAEYDESSIDRAKKFHTRWDNNNNETNDDNIKMHYDMYEHGNSHINKPYNPSKCNFSQHNRSHQQWLRVIKNRSHVSNRGRARGVQRSEYQNFNKECIKLPKTLIRELLGIATMHQLEVFQKEYHISRKVQARFLLAYYQENHKDALHHFKLFTYTNPQKIDPHYKNDSFAKLCCKFGGSLQGSKLAEEWNQFLEYLITHHQVDLRVDDDIMLEICATYNNIIGFALVFNSIITNKQQIDHEKLGSIMIFCAKEDNLDIIKILFRHQPFLNYLDLYLRTSIITALEYQKYTSFGYLCDYVVSNNFKNYEARCKILNKVILVCCALDDKKAYKFLITLITNITDENDENKYVLDIDLLGICIKNKSKKMGSFLVNKFLRTDKVTKNFINVCEEIIIECINNNCVVLIKPVTKILKKHNKKPNWNKIIKYLFEHKFLEKVNTDTFSYVINIFNKYEKLEKYDFNAFINYFLTDKIAEIQNIETFVAFLSSRDIHMPITYDTLPQYLENVFCNNNMPGLLFLCYVIILYYATTDKDNECDVTSIKELVHNINPLSIRNIFDSLLKEHNVFALLIKLLGEKYFVDQDIFYERLKISIECQDGMHLIILNICKQLGINLYLESENYVLFRNICEARNEASVKLCLEVYEASDICIDYSDSKIRVLLTRLQYYNPLLFNVIKTHKNYLKYLYSNQRSSVKTYGTVVGGPLRGYPQIPKISSIYDDSDYDSDNSTNSVKKNVSSSDGTDNEYDETGSSNDTDELELETIKFDNSDEIQKIKLDDDYLLTNQVAPTTTTSESEMYEMVYDYGYHMY